ncbi:UDP-N-acetylmuramate dehydrogenase [Eggerthellaceae bacterium 3-80]|nr:UDP-N-acetylmuramate dehydrogenase [bacterium D16-34]
MNYDAFADMLARSILGLSIKRQVPLAELTTFQIGGPAEIVVEPKTQAEIVSTVKACLQENVCYRIIGLGSDILASDAGVDEVVIRLAENYAHINKTDLPTPLRSLKDTHQAVYVEAGASNELVADTLCGWGLAGYEFACGIPGTIGGAAIMNAGAYDGEFSNVAYKVRCIDANGHVVEVDREHADWSYRHSMMDEAGFVVLGAYLVLATDEQAAITARMQDLQRKRAEKQPLEMPSAGSTFKRPKGYFAGKLIQDAGLRGFQVGGAQVSQKHTGFVVNAQGATAKDVCDLIEQVQIRVYESAGVWLEPEVRMWGFEEKE